MLSDSKSTSPGKNCLPAEQDPLTDYLLVCEARAESLSEGSWSFTLETAEGTTVFSAEDSDLGDLNRLTLLAAVRGLESIDGPASVMLLSSNRYLIRSLAESLPRWRENQFVWEHFGRRIDVQHADLWRRIDRALSIHRVHACLVSSRLVSAGLGSQGTSPGSESREKRWLRVDTPHQGGPAPGAGKVGLRRWLLGGGAGQANPAPRHRFTAADLLESA